MLAGQEAPVAGTFRLTMYSGQTVALWPTRWCPTPGQGYLDIIKFCAP